MTVFINGDLIDWSGSMAIIVIVVVSLLTLVSCNFSAGS